MMDDADIPTHTKKPFPLPKLIHTKTDDYYKSLSESMRLIGHLDPKDFKIENYQSHPPIKAPLSN
jgi:thymidylate synthase